MVDIAVALMTPSSQQPEDTASRAAGFGTTQWSTVLRAAQGAEEALVKLCQAYWPPLYAYTRRRGLGVQDAQDLTQAFFAHLLARRALGTVAPTKGRFRSFLLVSLKHFLDNEWHKGRTLKRGGDRVLIAWDALQPLEREALGPKEMLTPEKLFARRWAWVLLERVMEKLHNECAAAGKGALFDELQACLTGDPTGSSYVEIAAKLKLTEGAVKVSVHRLRRRFGELLRAQVAQTVEHPGEVSDEIRELFAALE